MGNIAREGENESKRGTEIRQKCAPSQTPALR